MPELNERQRQAVAHTEGPLLVLAGAGSGKTTVLIERIAALIERGVQPWRILAITFTNKAAGEIKERLGKRLGDKASDVWAHTFHSACVRILRRDIERIGFKRGFSIYDADDSQNLLRAILKDRGIDDKEYPPRWLLQMFSKAKDQLLTPSQLAKLAEDEREQTTADLFALYQRALREANAMDFDDILCHAVQLLLTCPDLLQSYQNRFEYIMIDEYQDTNHVQYLLASTLAAGRENLCVVGDDDQSIYRFRGATVENILNFQEQYPEAVTIRLEENYRSTGTILRAANALIAKNSRRLGKELWTKSGMGEAIVHIRAGDEANEALSVCSAIMKEVSGGASFRDFAVLYRLNAQSNTVEDALRRAAVPYRIIGGTPFFSTREVKDMLAYLFVIANPDDDLRLRRIVNVPARGIGAASLAAAEQTAAREGLSLYAAMSRADRFPDLSKGVKAMLGFAGLLNRLRDSALPLDALYQALLDGTRICEYWEAKPDPKDKERANNIRELKTSIAAYLSRTEQPTLDGFLEEVSLFTDIERYDEGADAVVLMTIHSAKGLEFNNVFIVGLEENIFPGARSLAEPDQIEEELRLCYVAVTRARKRLTVTTAHRRMLYGQTTVNAPSRFLNELPEDCVVLQERQRPHPPQRSEQSPRSQYIRRAAAPLPSPLPDFQPGMRITHKVFGNGLIAEARPMGNDCMLVIEFDQKGKKRLMAKSALSFIEMG